MIPTFIAANALKKMKDRSGQQDMHVGATISHEKKRTRVKKERVLNAKGDAPKMPSPEEEARAQMLLEQEKARLAQEKEARDRALEEKKRQEQIQKARTKQGQAVSYAETFLNNELGSRGISDALLDKYGIRSSYLSELDRAKMGFAEDDINPMASINTRTWLDNAINSGQKTYRNDLTKGVNSLAGDGFEYKTFADTSDDDILSEILLGQRGDAMMQIDAARARGQLNDVGYNKALAELERANEAGMSDLQTLGGGVLSGYRGQLSDLRNNQLDKIGSLSFTDSYDPNAFASLLTQRSTDLTGRMKGDITKAVGSKKFFDPSTMISGAGALQGFYNPTQGSQQSSTAGGGSLLDAFANDEAEKKKKLASTGTVNNGVF